MRRLLSVFVSATVFSFALFAQTVADTERTDWDSTLHLRQHQYGEEYLQVSRSVDYLNATLRASPDMYIQREYDVLMRPIHETIWKKNTTVQLSAEIYYHYEGDSVFPKRKEILQIPEKKYVRLDYDEKGLLEDELVLTAEKIPLETEISSPEFLTKRQSLVHWKYDSKGRTNEEIKVFFAENTSIESKLDGISQANDGSTKVIRKTWGYSPEGKKTSASVYENDVLVKQVEYLGAAERRETVFFENDVKITATYIDNDKKEEVYSKNGIAFKTRTY